MIEVHGVCHSFGRKRVLDGIDLSSLGMDGFVIKHYGNKILIAANNDTALLDAADYFINNVLDIKGGNATMPKDYLQKQVVKYPISNIEDIRIYSQQLKDTLMKYA